MKRFTIFMHLSRVIELMAVTFILDIRLALYFDEIAISVVTLKEKENGKTLLIFYAFVKQF